MTWADVDATTNNLSGGIAPNPINFNGGGALQVHNAGEIWANTLWEVRSRIIAANGSDVPTGNQITLQIVTDGMKLTPSNPSFVQARDALIDADCAANACANEQSIWDGFADRGLGYNAYAPISVMFGYTAGHMGLRESFTAPDLDINTITVDDSGGNNTGFIDPSEGVNIDVNLKNPWRNALKTATGITATISSSTPGVMILNGSTTFPNIAPNGNADLNGSDLVVQAPESACGTNLYFTLTVTSSLGVVAKDFSLRMGEPSGALPPVTYTRSGLGLAIPDNSPLGVIDAMTITDDYEIADLDIRINNLTHTFVGDLTFMVRGPNGYGADFMSILGGLTDGGSGDNLVNTVIDDEATNDLLTEVAASAPFTKSYRPAMNSPSWTIAGFSGPDSVPQLSRFDGTSTLGLWKAVVSDQFAFDTGTLNSWSLIVTPRDFVCTLANSAPEITPQAVSQARDSSSNQLIAVVSDAEDAAGDLTVEVDGASTVNGVTISNLSVDSNGNVTADVAATCSATNASFTLKVTDSSDQSSTTQLNVTVTPETTPPVINPIANITVALPPNATSVAVNFPLPTASDNCGMGTVTTDPVSGSQFPVGTTTVEVTATDAAGNQSFSSFTVTVQYSFSWFSFSGLLLSEQVLNQVTAGSTVPVRFTLFGNKGNPYSSPPTSQRFNCATQASIGAATVINRSLPDPSYSAMFDFYQTTWQTQAAWKFTCRRLTLHLNDGTTRSLDFYFK